MSTTAPSSPIPCISVPVDGFEIHNGPSRDWILRAMHELEENRTEEYPGRTFCYMRLTTGASSREFQRHVEVTDIQPVEGHSDAVAITIEVFEHSWSGYYKMHSRQGWVVCR